jgi:hypothetical protein
VAGRHAEAASPHDGVIDPVLLERLGLRCGEPIRFKRNGGGRWVEGRVSGIATDGSIQLYDPDGATRNLRPHMVEVRRPGTRGRLQWRVVSDVAITWEQLELW